MGSDRARRRAGGHATVSDTAATTVPATRGAETPAAVLPDVPRLPDRLVDQLAFPGRATYKRMVESFRQAGFEMCADLCAVDYLTHPGRPLPDGGVAGGFGGVVHL